MGGKAFSLCILIPQATFPVVLVCPISDWQSRDPWRIQGGVHDEMYMEGRLTVSDSKATPNAFCLLASFIGAFQNHTFLGQVHIYIYIYTQGHVYVLVEQLYFLAVSGDEWLRDLLRTNRLFAL